MKLKFEANQQYQLDAMKSVVDIFEGQPLESGDFEMTVTVPADRLQIGSEILVGNNLVLEQETILKNIQAIQERNKLPLSDNEFKDGMNFSTEMETGTGKTYVYLRTIHELNKKYGFKKFVIVVPSIAIKEGVMKNLEVTKEHFALLFDNPKMDFYIYDSKKKGQLRNFGTTDTLQVLVINIDSFTKKESNIIYQDSDDGIPVRYIQGVRPVVIVDEPQNMETDVRKTAIANLNPLCTLRYSATHKYPYHLLYKLDPVQAYDLGLVKKIEVDSVFSEDAYNDAYIRVLEIKSKKANITATIEIDKSDDCGLQRKEVVMKPGDDLFDLSGEREAYKDGFVMESISVTDQTVGFSNGKTFACGQKDEKLQDDIMKYQIKKTVENHFDKEKKLNGKGVKVLSLFFIDRVSNYREYNESGWGKGKFAQWFEEAYQEFQKKPQYQGVLEQDCGDVHDGYFAQDKKSGSWKDSSDAKGGEGGKTQADERAYELIMKNKEKLLDVNTPLRFIFSHSALREGWDNPNVFQICTLSETQSVMKKRQEIGRGLRLPVNQDGERIYDSNINVLTVIANESYEQFAKALQTEIEEDCGVSFSGRIKSKEKRRVVKLKKEYELDENFKDLWSRIKQRTQYHVEYDTEELIENAWRACLNINISKPRISNVRVRLNINEKGIGIEVRSVGGQTIRQETGVSAIPDAINNIQRKTRLTKQTIFEILKESDHLKDILVNPQQVVDEVTVKINETLTRMAVDGIKYEKIAGGFWEMQRFRNEELEEYLDRLIKVQDQQKTLYDHVITDSTVEETFAKDLESREDVKFYFKLPRWFKIETPLGGYNPDWAIVFENDKRVYFVAETKKEGEIRESEEMKITCGRAHFKVLDRVRFERVEKLEYLQID
ncbi:MAG: DEAD/DEAH box helicase family protein [Candidatus Uhrbacteria bacterium]|nr:DEAD/DEAH box helicase family protein [Candidatus Uhrbacteria bacterium]